MGPMPLIMNCTSPLISATAAGAAPLYGIRCKFKPADFSMSAVCR
ncbi:Uncharacterised protein [Bordetella pertussis]|nr:Uncharacterised protein [Bordetella pertussis]